MYQAKEGGEPQVPVWGGEELLEMFTLGNGTGLNSFATPSQEKNSKDEMYAGSDNHYYDSDLPA